jgi:hypothetical protein
MEWQNGRMAEWHNGRMAGMADGIHIDDLMGPRGDSHSQYYIDAPAEFLTVRYG